MPSSALSSQTEHSVRLNQGLGAVMLKTRVLLFYTFSRLLRRSSGGWK